MSEPSETSGHPLAPTTKQEKEPENNTINLLSSTHTKHRKSSQPSDDCSEVSKSTSPRRRPGSTTKAPSGPHAGPSRSKQQSTTHSANMMSQSSSINYTRTGRISKAKKGLKVHNCECGRVCYMLLWLFCFTVSSSWLAEHTALLSHGEPTFAPGVQLC
jgi:hypothetical protein